MNLNWIDFLVCGYVVSNLLGIIIFECVSEVRSKKEKK